jgi:hypothetical protein
MILTTSTTRHGVVDRLGVYATGNLGPHRPSNGLDPLKGLFVDHGSGILQASPDVRTQISKDRLVIPPVTVTTQSAEAAAQLVVEQAGCNLRRDAEDRRILDDVGQGHYGRIMHSQADVGGWPELKR